MKKQTNAKVAVTSIQILFGCTFLLPLTIVLGVVWLCQVYHRCIEKQSRHQKGADCLNPISKLCDGAAAREPGSVLLPVYFSV